MSACVRRLGCAVLGAESRARFAVTPVRTVCLQQCSHRPVATDCESSSVVSLTHARPRYCGVSSGGLVGRVRHASTEAQDPAGAYHSVSRLSDSARAMAKRCQVVSTTPARRSLKQLNLPQAQRGSRSRTLPSVSGCTSRGARLRHLRNFPGQVSVVSGEPVEFGSRCDQG